MHTFSINLQMNRILNLAIFLVCSVSAQAEEALPHRCGTGDPTITLAMEWEDSIEAFAGITSTRFMEPVTIPIAFHLVRNRPDGTIAATEAQLFEQLAILNQAYEPINLQFTIQSITETVAPEWDFLFQGSEQEIAMKELLHLPVAEVLNIYVCHPLGYIGWASFPKQGAEDDYYQGIVLLDETLPGGSNPLYEGDTLVHEVGHYLGLLHTFAGRCDGEVHDGIDDTPRHQANYGRPPEWTDTCPGDAFHDPVHNYMNYVEDAWMWEFTEGQMERMITLTSLYRPTMVSNRYPWMDYPREFANWRYIPWLGWINDQSYPWVWHAEHGWLGVSSPAEDTFWFYDPGQLGWFFTTSELYPYIYVMDSGSWYYYAGKSQNTRWFWDYSSEGWIGIED